MGMAQEYVVTIIFEALDLDREESLAALAALGAVGATPHDASSVAVTFLLDGPNAVAAAANAISELQLKLPDTKAVMARRDLVNTSDIAERVGVTREGVRNWVEGKRRSGGFPHPLADPGGQKVWEWSHVNAWLAANLGLGDGNQYPTHCELGEIDAFIAQCAEAAPGSAVSVAGHWRKIDSPKPPVDLTATTAAVVSEIDSEYEVTAWSGSAQAAAAL